MTALASVIIGAVITGLTQLAKKMNIPAKVALAVLVVIVAAGYTVFQHYFDESTRLQIISFATSAFGSAVFFYEYGIKFLEKKE